MTIKLSVIFSTFNEMKLPFFEDSLKLLSNFTEIEVICVDNSSTDGTIECCKKYAVQLITVKDNSRASRQNVGVKSASSEYILLHHPRSILTYEGINYLLNNQKKILWGGFTHCFDNKKAIYKFTSWYSNIVRAKIRNIIYLDHCIFFKRELYDNIGGVPEVDIFEDTLFTQKLAQTSACTIIPYYSKTSSVRFESNGVWRQAILNQVLKIAFLFKANHQTMNKIYELGLNLNSKY